MIQQVQLILLQMQVFKNHLMNVSLIQLNYYLSTYFISTKCKSYYCFNDGVVDGFDTHENLLETNEIYRTIYETQMKGKEEK